jgi:HAE1 family hydrophobic/amphiphilic exporter-1
VSRLTELSVAKRSVTLLLAVGLFIAGVSAWGSLKQELLPDIDFPVITVIAPLPGAGAADVANQVTKPIERSIASIPRLSALSSSSANSIAIVVAQFEFGTDVKEARSTIEQNLQTAGLPQSVSPQVSALNINASPVIIASVAGTSQDGLDAAAEVARTQVVPALQGIDGVATVDLTGGLESQVVVTLDPARLTATRISVAQVSGILAANNLTIPSGQVTTEGTNLPVSTIGTITSVAQIENLVVGFKLPTSQAPGAGAGTGTGTVPGTQPGAAPTAPVAPTPILLKDIATVAEVGVPTTGYARTDGVPSLTLTVTKTSNANTVEVADAVTAELKAIDAANAEVEILVISDLSTFIKESRDGLLREGGLGALFAILTIFLFLFSIRATLVAAVSIPLSILTALVIMQIAGITINVMTLGGLAVAVGRVVDDAIVVLENIYRHRALGDDRLTAVLRGPREVAAAITSATLTTVAVFLPLGLVGGIVSQLFLPFALTVTFALLASLVVALTVVPVLAFLFIGRVKLNVDEDGEPKNSFWIRAYTPSITFALRSRATKWSILLVAAVLFIGSMALVPLLPTQFINAGSERTLQVTIAPPAGASSTAVLDRAIEAEKIVLGDTGNVEHVQTSVPGEGGTSFGTLLAALSGRPANSATLTVRLVDGVDPSTYAQQLSADLAPVKTDGYDVAVAQTAGFSSNGLSVVISSDNPDDVAIATDEVMTALGDNTDLLNLKSNLTKGTPEVQVVVDPNKAIGAGLTAAQVAGEVRTTLVGAKATTVLLEGATDAVPLFVQVDPAQVTSVETLGQLPVGTTVTVQLGTIAAVDEVLAQGSITRVDQAPAATVSAEIASDNTGAVSTAVQAEIDGLVAAGKIPAGVTIELAGVTQQQNEAFGNLFVSMGVAILLVYVMMVLTFNSLITPFIILFSLPLATIGAFLALYLTGKPIGVSALIGLLMLIGIVVTNAIVLLDLVERLRSQGHSTKDALIEGGRTRIRPILMTAIATILALIPLAAGLSQGSIIAAELGTVVIGGLFSSTFLTLLVIPILYSLVDGGKSGLARRFRGAEPAAPEATAADQGAVAPPTQPAPAG